MPRLAVSHLLFLLLAAPAPAIDGVILLDQQAAVLGGTIPGDAAGFPITIGAAGSYRLTSNLDLRSEADAANLTAIRIDADDVTLDLNGFAIIGPTECNGGVPPETAVTCAPSGSGKGIDTETSASANLAVLNGTIMGMAEYGARLDAGGWVDRVRFTHNRRALYGVSSVVTRCSFWRNEGGAYVVSGVVVGDTFWSNDRPNLLQDVVVADGASYQNHLAGFTVRTSVVRANVAMDNGGAAVSVSTAAVVVGNAMSVNAAGVDTAGDTLVAGNSLYANTSFGVNASAASTIYTLNVLSHNGTSNGPQVSGATAVATNLCGTDLVCP